MNDYEKESHDFIMLGSRFMLGAGTIGGVLLLIWLTTITTLSVASAFGLYQTDRECYSVCQTLGYSGGNRLFPGSHCKCYNYIEKSK